VKVGDLVEYGPNLGPQWKKKHVGVVVEVSEFIRVIFLLEREERPSWYHRDNLEVISENKT
jgi:hypothetical protein